MEIRNLQDRDIDGVVELWNESCVPKCLQAIYPGKL